MITDIRNVKVGDFLRRKEGAKTTYVRGAYDRATKSYSCTDAEDMNREIFIKAGKAVHVGFTY